MPITSSPQAVEIYNLYPRKVKKPLALRAIMQAIKRDGFEKVRDATRAYAERAADRDMQFIPHPSTFFNQEIYNDDLDAVLPRNNGHKEIPVTLRIRAVEKLIEDNKKVLLQTPLPSPMRYVNERASPRFQKDFDEAMKKRTELKQDRARLESQLRELNQKIL